MNMYKDFYKWNDKKIILHNDVHGSYFKEREIWFASVGCNIGHEEDGKGKDFQRPVIILKKLNFETFWGIPLTSRFQDGKYFLPIDCNGVRSTAKLSQLKLFDSRRLIRRIGRIENSDMNLLKEKLYLMLFEQKNGA